MALLPLRKMVRAAEVMYDGADVELPGSWIGISDEPDGAEFVILDAEKGAY